MRLPTLLLICALSDLLAVPSSSGDLVQVRQDFSRDPGWDHYQNRIVGTEMPAVIQDFGWRRTGHTGGPGEIGGRVENSRVQADYALPLGTHVEMYLGDLTVNGQKLDLSQDPRWEGRNNGSRYTEPNFHAMHSYGWSQTNWTGEKPGEIGGLFWRTEPRDPLCSYYGDDVGELTLEDPISFSGTICFTDGMTDAAAFFGNFNRDNQIQDFDAARSDAFSPAGSSMGIAIADSSAVGYYFTPRVTSTGREGVRKACEVFTPDRRRRRFTFDDDPRGNGGTGQVTVTLDGRAYALDLTPRQRKPGAVFNRFGLANVRSGGHSVEFYLDDMTYTARREPGPRPRFIPQRTVEVPYPHKQGGRRY